VSQSLKIFTIAGSLMMLGILGGSAAHSFGAKDLSDAFMWPFLVGMIMVVCLVGFLGLRHLWREIDSWGGSSSERKDGK
jgi:hypothetical protein